MNDKNLIYLFFFIALPVLVLPCQLAAEHFLPTEAAISLLSENGPYELVHFLLTALGLLIALIKFFEFAKIKHFLLMGWSALAALCCLYVTGEEVSWGQHFFKWSTPEYWHHINDQQETNLHNTTSWLDQKPRLILLLGIVFGSLILPSFEKYKKVVPDAFRILLPDPRLKITALMVILPQIIEKTGEIFSLQLFVRFSEFQETYLFYYVVLYLICLSAQKNTKANI